MSSLSSNISVTARGLVKRYGDVTALAGLDLDVPSGSVLGLLGPNGAGKTTAVSILTTLVQPDEGSATVAGVDVIADPRGARAASACRANMPQSTSTSPPPRISR
jgi:ABC-2 type transport system ATP-binding protein